MSWLTGKHLCKPNTGNRFMLELSEATHALDGLARHMVFDAGASNLRKIHDVLEQASRMMI